MTHKNTLKTLALVATVVMLVSCFFLTGITASAASYVVDGNELYLAADLNDDGIINVCDLVGAYLNPATPAADFDSDGSVGDYDHALIRGMILGIDKSQWAE